MPDDLVQREDLEDDLDGIAERMEQFLQHYAALQDDKRQSILPSIYSRIQTANGIVREAMSLL